MLITEKVSNDSLAIQSNYSKSYVDRFRKVPGAKFNGESKKWIVPITSFHLYEELFKGEIIYKTPRWMILGEPAPDYSDMYQLDETIILPKLKLDPYDYQEYGIRFMIDRLNSTGFVINADSVGLGKTIETVGSMYYFYKAKKIRRTLVVCKKSLKRQWVSEIGKFSDIPDRIPVVYTEGTKAKRRKTYDLFNENPFGVLVTNYHTVMNDTDLLVDMEFDYVIVDEAHSIKNRSGVQNKAATKVCDKAKYVAFLTGTPIMSKPDDIFGVVQIADKDYFGKWSAFKKKHIREEFNGRFANTVGYKKLDELRDQVQNVVIRRTEHEVTLQLPETIQNRINVDLDKTQATLIEQIKADRTEYLDELELLEKKQRPTDKEQERMLTLDGMSKGLSAALQAVADDPRLINLSKSKMMKMKYSPLVPKSYKTSNKTEATVELVEEILNLGEKVIIFSEFERATRLIDQDIRKKLKCNVLSYTGAVDDDQREENIELFKNSDKHNVLLATNAASEGLNLQKANHVVNYDQPHTPAIKTQRGGRVRRVGSQFSRVYMYDIITEKSEDIQRLEKIDKAENLFDGLVGVDKAQSVAIKNASM